MKSIKLSGIYAAVLVMLICSPVAAFASGDKEHLTVPTPSTVDALSEITSLANYYAENLERYLDYRQRNLNLTTAEVVLRVNIGLDKPFYSDVEEIVNPVSLLVLCNKYNMLPANYIPEGYGRYDYHAMELRKEAQDSFNLMQKSARKDGVNIYLVSGYRSYLAQKTIYEGYKAENPEAVDNFSSRAGSSEHQTGLAADINTVYSKDRFERTSEFNWLQNNAHKYGFILRYPAEKEHITGYRFEPWHWRYVGEDVAMMIWEEGITLEEFFAGLPVGW